MEDNKSYLKKLIGQSIKSVDFDINTIATLKEKKDDQSEQHMSVYTQLYFDQYRLDIFNKTKIVGGINLANKDLVGLKVIGTSETDENAELIFDNSYRLLIDLGDEVYNGEPEAMCLQGPDNLIVVWDK